MNDDNCQDCLQQETKLCPITGEQYTEQLRYLLPRGHAWNPCDWLESRLYQYWRSFGELLATAHNRMCDYLNESFPCTATEALSDWERVVGIPDECFPEITDLNARQQRVCALLGAQNGNDCAFMVALAASIGWEVECQDLSKQPLAMAGCMQIGCDQLPPVLTNRGIGSNLGHEFIGDCGVMGSNLGCPPDDECCPRAGDQATISIENENQEYSHCVNPLKTDEKLLGQTMLGCAPEMPAYRPYAHHWLICLKFGEGNTVIAARCEDHFIIGCGLVGHDLGTYKSANPDAPNPFEDTANAGCACAGESLGCVFYLPLEPTSQWIMAGCSTAGCSAVCVPNWKEVFCLLERYKPAHTVLTYKFC